MTAFAGGWSSGGGELLKDARNPWFLNNTSDVYYCVSVDEANFGASRSVIEKKLDQAITFWKSEFDSALLAHLPKFGELKIASQVFHEVDCSEQVDIKFQFGTLSEAQKKYLKKPSEYAAVSVRTSYREKDLRGKGFVYLSPMKGPLAYNPEGVVRNAWTNDQSNLLYLTLLHELGHVFGLPHIGSLGDLMSEGFVESILWPTNTSSSHTSEPHFFSLPTSSLVICPQEPLAKIWSDFFELLSSEKCLQFVFRHDQKSQLFGPTTLKVLASSTSTSPQRLVTELQISISRFFPVAMNLIWLPAGQELFSKNEFVTIGAPGIVGPSLMSVSKQGSYILNDGKTKHHLSVRFEQGKSTFFVDGVGSEGAFITIL
jgi:hypothetical protein